MYMYPTVMHAVKAVMGSHPSYPRKEARMKSICGYLEEVVDVLKEQPEYALTDFWIEATFRSHLSLSKARSKCKKTFDSFLLFLHYSL